jgi:hypothetical protein
MRSIILDYAIERKGEMKTTYKYDFSEALNVITVEGKKLPFIDSAHENIVLLTKTKVRQERDDNNIDMLEPQIKVYRERYDDYNLLLEFQTKTLTQRERDDESFNYN